MAHPLASNLQPAAFVRQIMTMGRTGFGLLYPDLQLLLVRLPPGSEALVEGLSLDSAQGRAEGRAPAPRDFHTDKSTDITGLFRVKSAPSPLNDGDAKAWAAFLGESSHFVVPIRKRQAADGMSSDKISVGRAHNKDIVLRHGTVSKFHGWFQLNDAHELCFMDIGSKNGTRVNAKAIGSRQLVELHPGDRLQIGRVECVLCAPDALWSALHLAPKRMTRAR